MRVLIDALSARVGGGVTYIENILPALAGLSESDVYTVLLSARYQSELIANVPPTVTVIDVPVRAKPFVLRWFRVQLAIHQLRRRGHADILFAPAENVYPFVGMPVVMLLRNLAIYLPAPRSTARLRLLLYRILRKPAVRWSVGKVARLIFVSETARRLITNELAVPSGSGHIIHHGVSSKFFVHPDNVPQRRCEYLLAVSTVTPHKNYDVLIRAFTLLRRRPEFSRLRLVIAGGLKDADTVERLRTIASDARVDKEVDWLGQVPLPELPPLYARAAVFVFPSDLETFGNPLLEAMAAGVPVVAADTEVSRELCGDVAEYFPAESSTALADVLTAILSEPDRRKQMSERGRTRARQFSWTRTAKQLSNVFADVAGQSSGSDA